MPLISFIITYYNLPTDMIRKCLLSILQLPLDVSEREIILVDDGSDKSPLCELTDIVGHITYIRQKNGGLSAARNAGIDIAKGQYLQFVDGDDYLISDAYAQCIDIAKRQEPDVVMFRLTHESRGASGEGRGSRVEGRAAVTGTEYLTHNNLRAAACGYMFKRSLLGTLRFTPGILHEDEEFTPLLILRAETVVDTDIKAYLYYVREDSIITKRDNEWITRRLTDHHTVILSLREHATRMHGAEGTALKRRIAQLTMTYIYSVITLTKDFRELENNIRLLYQDGLFPLPDNNYNKKYTWFRILSSTKAGRWLLLQTLKNTKE